jgi:hypothetical protein
MEANDKDNEDNKDNKDNKEDNQTRKKGKKKRRRSRSHSRHTILYIFLNNKYQQMLSQMGLCHKMNIFFEAYINKQVLSVHALIVFTALCFFLDEKKLKVLDCSLENHQRIHRKYCLKCLHLPKNYPPRDTVLLKR